MFKEIYIHTFERNGKPATLRERLEMRKTCGPYRWTPAEPGQGRGFYQSSKGLWCGDSTFDLRLVYANELLPWYFKLRRTEGYYVDMDEILTPIVARLPHGRGFLAGWTMGPGMCASLDGHVWHDPESAARAAHQEAEQAAEREREYRERESEQEDSEVQGGLNDDFQNAV